MPPRGGRRGRRCPRAGMSAGPRSLPAYTGQVFAAAGYETAYFGKWHLGGTPGDSVSRRTTPRSPSTHSPATSSNSCRARAQTPERRPLFLVVSWVNPHDIYNVLNDGPAGARALAADRPPLRTCSTLCS